MYCWRHVLWCLSAQTHVIEVGWSIERFGGRAIWQACSRSGTSFWSRCAQNVPACSIHLHFLFAVYTHGVHGKIGCLSICDLVEWWRPAVQLPSTGVHRVNSRQEVQRSISLLWKVIAVCHSKLESSGVPRVKGQVGCQN